MSSVAPSRTGRRCCTITSRGRRTRPCSISRKTRRSSLVLMQPKSLLRLPLAASHLADLVSGTFQPVIDDANAAEEPLKVRRLVLCTGKIYYDLLAAAQATGTSQAQGTGASGASR